MKFRKIPLTYTPESSQRSHAINNKAALEFLENNPEIREWARTNALADIRNEIQDLITKEAHDLSDQMLQFGVRLCPDIARIWIATELEKNIRGTTEWFAGIALYNGDSKANIARAAGVRANNCEVRFPQLQEINDAIEKNDAGQGPITLKIRGDEFTIGEEDSDHGASSAEV